MGHLAVAGLQLALEIEDNLSVIEREIDLVIKRFPWVQMVVLPELCTFGTSTELALEMPGEVESCFQEAARKNGIWLIPGSIFENHEEGIFNTAPVINPVGDVIARYRKIFPFYPYEKGVSCGEEFVIFDVPGAGRFGLITCYDQWFPEILRTLTWMGVEAIICPTLTNTTDRDVELAIARSNAAIHQVYYLNINGAGRLAYGRSLVAGPDGIVIHQAGSGREIITVEIDFDHIRRVRERGMYGLTQPLKSFRDRKVQFPVYKDGAGGGAFDKLGPLEVPRRSDSKFEG